MYSELIAKTRHRALWLRRASTRVGLRIAVGAAVLLLAVGCQAPEADETTGGPTQSGPMTSGISESLQIDGTEVQEVEVDIGVTHGFSSDIEIQRSALSALLDDLAAAEPELDLAPMRSTVAELEAALESAPADAAGPTSEITTLVDQLGVQLEELKAEAPAADFTALEQAVAELRESVAE